MSVIRRFRSDEQAQDLVEYTLLLMVAVLGSAGLMMSSTASTSAVWTQANSALLGQLNTGSSNSTSTTQPTTPPTGTGSGGGDHRDHDGHDGH